MWMANSHVPAIDADFDELYRVVEGRACHFEDGVVAWLHLVDTNSQNATSPPNTSAAFSDELSMQSRGSSVVVE